MIYLAHAEYLLLILLIPVFFIMYRVMRKLRRKRMAKLGDVGLVENLAPAVSKRKGWVKLTFLSLALVFFAIGMARPQIGAKLSKKEIKGAEIMVVLDVSNSMLAEDYTPNRLERAKLAVSKLVDGLHEDRIGLIIFAGQSFVQLPITSDYVSAKIFLNNITNESVPVQGTALGEAIRTAARSFTQESGESRAIILITDGENHEDDPVSAAKDAASVGARVFCVGVGSAQGKPIPMNGELLKDENGEIVVTKLDEQTLRQVAEAGNGLYVRAGNAEFGLNPIIDEIRSFEAKHFQSVVFEEYNEQYMYFFAIALIFLLVEFCISDTRNGRNLFKNNRAVAVVCLLLLPAALMAQDDKKPVRKGNKEFKKGDYNAAEIEYKRGLATDSSSVFSKYNLANALYRTDSFSEAELYMKDLGDTLKNLSTEKASDYFHNNGNIALKQKKYQEAVDAYKESLRLKPDDMATKENLAYAQKMLKDSQNQQQQQQQNGDGQNQDNQDQQQNQENQDRQNQDNQDRNQEQNQDKQDENQQQEQNQQQQEQPKISPQAAQQMLQAIEDKEKQTQEKVRKEKAEKQENQKKKKNW